MNSKLLYFVLLIVLFSSCKKDHQEPKIIPAASFDIGNFTASAGSSYTVPTFTPVTTVNKSSDAAAYLWKSSDGSSSSDKEPQFRFKKAGTYKITLLTTSTTGDTASSSKSFTVVDRHLYAVKISNPNWANGRILNLFVRVYNPAANNAVPNLSGDQYSSVISYQSSVVNVVYNSQVAINLDLPGNFTLTPGKDLLTGVSNDLFVNYGYCLYSNDNNVEHLLASSWDSNNVPIYNEVLNLGISTLETRNQGLTATYFANNTK
ncbi:PKD domain-containing protein [Mucilaginibacter polytrichastri]|uniref:PKD domain-containing protein n=1 Tax=Mucilaginibacter polytrichastri TaxID=1302689 RepID=A0A1Q5ZWB0_9SPHI|nr:PKD domain-containing protein [Mucilaginibacter polytrichastri]OKS86064.1 hypothetical protein RG47T_1511 [Mucilaginibacter polytrichastri]SFS59204.1 hypothetical protein SAMN04487890_10277 [Mucilaginibacter polytrichastri]